MIIIYILSLIENIHNLNAYTKIELQMNNNLWKNGQTNWILNKWIWKQWIPFFNYMIDEGRKKLILLCIGDYVKKYSQIFLKGKEVP
jgi:hypothetical protein